MMRIMECLFFTEMLIHSSNGNAQSFIVRITHHHPETNHPVSLAQAVPERFVYDR